MRPGGRRLRVDAARDVVAEERHNGLGLRGHLTTYIYIYIYMYNIHNTYIHTYLHTQYTYAHTCTYTHVYMKIDIWEIIYI